MQWFIDWNVKSCRHHTWDAPAVGTRSLWTQPPWLRPLQFRTRPVYHYGFYSSCTGYVMKCVCRTTARVSLFKYIWHHPEQVNLNQVWINTVYQSWSLLLDKKKKDNTEYRVVYQFEASVCVCFFTLENILHSCQRSF